MPGDLIVAATFFSETMIRRSRLLFYLFFIPCFYSAAQGIQTGDQLIGESGSDTILLNRYLQSAALLADRDPDSARRLLAHVYRLAMADQDKPALAEYYHVMVTLLINKNQFQAALDYAKKEQNLTLEINDSRVRIKSLNSLANVYEYLGIMDSAGRYFLDALSLADNLKDKTWQRRLNNNLSSILYYTGDYQKGMQYAVTGYRLAGEIHDTSAIITSLLNISGFEAALKEYDSSLNHIHAVMELARRTNNKLKMLDALNNLGELLSDLGRNREALEKYEQMMQLSRETERPDYRMYAEGNMGNTLAKLSRYKEGEPHLAAAIQIAENIHASNELQQWLSFMADLQHRQGNNKAAFIYLKRYQNLKDSLMNIQTKKNTRQLEMQYQSAKKDKELADQGLSIVRQHAAIQRKNSLLFIFISGILSLILILFVSRRNYRNKRRLHGQAVLAMQKEQEVIRLKAMMEGQAQERRRISGEMHDDIGSGLTSILFLSGRLKNSSVTEDQRTVEKITRNANALIGKMNEIIWSMNTDYDSLEDLLTYTRNHAGEFLEQAGLRYQFDFPDTIPDKKLSGEQRRNIYLVIKEGLHNVVKHAQASQVRIEVVLNEKLTVTIRDNGKGISNEKPASFGNGLKNMRQRMESIGGRFEISNDRGTLIRLFVPLLG